MLGQNFEDRTRHAKATLGRLKRIRRHADDDRVASEKREMLVRSVAQRSPKHVAGVLLHEDSALEREPRRKRVARRAKIIALGVLVRAPIEHPPMRVARVAVRASERAAHVRVHRPEAHAGDFRAVQDIPRDSAEVLDVLLLTHAGERAPHDVRLEQRILLEPTDHLEPARENRELTLPKKDRKRKMGDGRWALGDGRRTNYSNGLT